MGPCETNDSVRTFTAMAIGERIIHLFAIQPPPLPCLIQEPPLSVLNWQMFWTGKVFPPLVKELAALLFSEPSEKVFHETSKDKAVNRGIIGLKCEWEPKHHLNV